MNSKKDHGVSVDVDEIRSVLEPTRELRLALDILSGSLSPDMETDATGAALWDLHERLCKAELKVLRIWGLPRAYVIISPINPMNPPSREDMEKIARAIQTLDDLGLIVVP
jgi:hypothetical protein